MVYAVSFLQWDRCLVLRSPTCRLAGRSTRMDGLGSLPTFLCGGSEEGV